MTQAVNVPGIGTLNFPDGMSQQDMAAAIQKNFPQIHNQAQPSNPTWDFLKNTAQTELNGIKGIFGDIGTVLNSPTALANHAITSLDKLQANNGAMPGMMANLAPNLVNSPAYSQPIKPSGDQAKSEAMQRLIADIGTPLAMMAATPTAETSVLQGPPAPIKPGLVGQALDEIKDVGARIVSPQQRAQQAVGSVLNRSATNPSAVINAVKAPVQLSTAGTSLDPGIMSLERAVRMRSTPEEGANEAFFQNQQGKTNSVIRGMFDQLGNTTKAPEEASTDAYTALAKQYEQAQAREKELWSKVPDNTKLNIGNTINAINKYMANQSLTNQRIISRTAANPIDDLRAVFDHYSKGGSLEPEDVQIPFSEIKDIRSSLGEVTRNAGANGDRNAARLLKGLDDTILNSLGNENAFAPGAKQLGKAYNDARFFTSNMRSQQFTPEVMNLFDQDPSKAAQYIFQSPESIESYLNAAGNTPQAKKALGDYLTSTLVNRSNVAARGGIENFTNGQTLDKWIAQNPKTLEKVFTPKQIQTLKNIASLSKRNIAAEQATPRIGSDTIGKGLGNKVLDNYLGNSRVVKFLTKPYAGQFETNLRNALLDPDTAKQLMQAAQNMPKTKALPSVYEQWLQAQLPRTAIGALQGTKQ